MIGIFKFNRHCYLYCLKRFSKKITMSFRHCYFNFDINIWIFVNVFNNEKHIDKCFESIKNQTYKLINILVIDDNSSDLSQSIIDKWGDSLPFVFKKNEQVLGLYKCKLMAFEYIKKSASANDLFIEISPYFTFSNNSTLEDLVISSVWNKSWFTYGPLIRLPSLKSKGDNVNLQYYLMNTFLLDYFTKEDLIEGGRGLLNRIIIKKCLELCGPKRSFYSSVSINNSEEDIQKTQIITTLGVKLIPDTIHILIHTYFKHYNLPYILKTIDNSDYHNREVIVHVINSNFDRVAETNSLHNVSLNNIKLCIFNSSSNSIYYSYLSYIRNLLKSCPSSYAIILNEENIITKNWINDAAGFFSPLTYSCGSGIEFNKSICAGEITFNSVRVSTNEGVFDYGKIEGSVLDMSLALSSSFFNIDLKLLPVIEDLWLSFLTSQMFGKKIININKKLDICSSPQTVNLTSKNWITKEKAELLPKLIEAGFLNSTHINLIKLAKLLRSFKETIPKDLGITLKTVKSINQKITLVVMNCHRANTLQNIILPFYDLNCSKFINQIIVYHANKETMFEYKPHNKEVEVINIYNKEDEIRYALFNRFIQAAKYSNNECVLIIDDDVIPDIDRIELTFNSWKSNKMNLHGSSGRFCSNNASFNYVIKHINSCRVPIILTSFVMTSLDLIKYCISEEHKVYHLVSKYKPKWNGEDIFLSLCAVILTKQHNFVVNSKYEIITFKRDNFAISGDSSHVKCRTELCNAVCEIYNLDKRDTLTNYKYL